MLTRNSLGALAVGAALLTTSLPATALAKGGGGGGGGGTTGCTALTPLNSGVVDKPASGRPVTVDFQLRNCATGTATLATSLVGTALTVTSTDPFTTATCSTAPYSTQTLTLKPGEARSISAASTWPYCGYSLWGVTAQFDVTYDATTRNTATGEV